MKSSEYIKDLTKMVRKSNTLSLQEKRNTIQSLHKILREDTSNNYKYSEEYFREIARNLEDSDDYDWDEIGGDAVFWELMYALKERLDNPKDFETLVDLYYNGTKRSYSLYDCLFDYYSFDVDDSYYDEWIRDFCYFKPENFNGMIEFLKNISFEELKYLRASSRYSVEDVLLKAAKYHSDWFDIR